MDTNKKIIATGLLIIATFLIFSCDNKKNTLPVNVIPVASTVGDYSILNLSNYATDIKYIPLETNDSVLISNIRNISYENNKILVAGSNKQFLFDNNGKFLRAIGQQGQGPTDFIRVSQSIIHENQIFTSDGQKILVYDTTGHLIKKSNLWSSDIPKEYNSWTGQILPLKKDIFVMNVATFSGYCPKAILFETYQSEATMIKDYPSHVTLDKAKAGIMTIEQGVMYRFKDDVRIYKIISDTIFTIGQNMEMKEAFIFELGKYKPTLAFMERKEGDINDPLAMRSGKEKYIVPEIINESLNYLFITFDFGNHAPEPIPVIIQGETYYDNFVYGIFDKRTGELALMHQPIKGKSGLKNDIDGGPVIWPHFISSNNELITYISAEEFLEYYEKMENPSPQLTEIANRIDRDDNQIVIIAKLK